MAVLATKQYGVVNRTQLAALGFGGRAIQIRLRDGRLHPLHRGVYAVGHERVNQRGHWLAAVLAGGDGALLSHGSAAALWGLQRPRWPIEVTSRHGRRGRRGIVHHEGRIHPQDRAVRDGIPVTSVARTVFDLAEVVDEERVARLIEEADRLKLLQVRALEAVCERGQGRRAVRPIGRILACLHAPDRKRSPLENRFAAFCRTHRLPPPATNVLVLGHEVDVLWPAARLTVELDSWEFHGHRAAFRHDRARDSALLVAGYRTVRVTHERLDTEAPILLAELRVLLSLPE